MMGVVDRTTIFFNARPKQQKTREKAASATQPGAASNNVKDLCRTRWVQCFDALEVCNAPATEWSRDSLTDSRDRLSDINTTEV